MSPEQIRSADMQCLAQRAVEALGVNGDGNAAHIMEHAIAQACLELGLVEATLDRHVDDTTNEELMGALYVLAGVRARLTMAQHSASFLATVLSEGRSANG